jgi:DNA-binding MarR family transcriptional regulator
MANSLPEDVKQFLTEHISSVAQLEVLLLLRRDPERMWTAGEVAKALYTTPEIVADQLSDLRKRGLVGSTGDSELKYRYSPETDELAEQVARLDTAYKERSVAVITFIYSQPVEQVRVFADAFRLRKEK